jgi:hypothetical protein
MGCSTVPQSFSPDNPLPPETLTHENFHQALARHVKDGLVDYQAGGFRHRFSGKDWRLRMISWLDNLRCTYSHIIYGDQALFVRQGLFTRLGGFPTQRVLEDVAFGQTLLTHTIPRLLPLTVLTDSRKFLKMGVWRSYIRVLMIILHVEFGLPTFSPAFFQDVR